ncbi:hypothetical protein OSTOST_02822 [Ostertagia ostertagi]
MFQVQPGELCSCRKNVDGRICDQCKPTFWDLQYHHPDGCIDIMQSEKVVFAPTSSPAVKEVTVAGKPFVLNPGKWTLGVNTKQRLFLDYIVVLPAEYYLGTILKERAAPPCEANNAHNSTCVDLLYPPMAIAARADITEATDTFKGSADRRHHSRSEEGEN